MRSIAVFLVTAFGLAIALSLAVGLTGGSRSPIIGVGYLTMLCPAAAVAVVSRTVHEPARIDWSRMPARYVPAALLLMPALLHAAMLPAMLAVVGRLPWMNGILWPRVMTDALVGLFVVSALA